MYQYRATHWKTFTGDTVELMVSLGFGVHKRVIFRLLDVTAPKLNEPGGVPCRDKLTELLSKTGEGGTHVITTHKPAAGGRWLVDVPLVNDAMREFIAIGAWEK